MTSVRNPLAPGFTLIELLIGIVVFMLMLLLAGPIYNEFVANAKIRNGGEAVLNGIRLSQSEALKHNLPAVFALDPATGFVVTIDDPEKPGTPLFQKTYLFADGAPNAVVTVAPANATQLTFDGLGRLNPNDDGSPPIRTVDITHGSIPNPRALRVVVSDAKVGVGTMLCDPATSIPPTACP